MSKLRSTDPRVKFPPCALEPGDLRSARATPGGAPKRSPTGSSAQARELARQSVCFACCDFAVGLVELTRGDFRFAVELLIAAADAQRPTFDRVAARVSRRPGGLGGRFDSRDAAGCPPIAGGHQGPALAQVELDAEKTRKKRAAPEALDEIPDFGAGQPANLPGKLRSARRPDRVSLKGTAKTPRKPRAALDLGELGPTQPPATTPGPQSRAGREVPPPGVALGAASAAPSASPPDRGGRSPKARRGGFVQLPLFADSSGDAGNSRARRRDLAGRSGGASNTPPQYASNPGSGRTRGKP